ncbi:MAG: type II toxin-antitoxin system HicB family antitoxin [Spirochaetia bacterium]|jgi:predicted RNase H-like HicB family nuclease|nr:type II toxin-antitoxin system HicB family antitoxin [Spirochaetia bacterium]
MHRTIQVNIYPGENGWFVAEAIHLPVVTQGKSIDETIKNLRDALYLHLEGEDLREIGLYKDAPVVITMEMEPVYA